MYYIYHIPGVKIGCSTNPKRRVSSQGYSEYQILETHSDIDLVSERELELQKQYGYKVDCVKYSSANYSKRNKLNGIKALNSHLPLTWKKERSEKQKENFRIAKEKANLGPRSDKQKEHLQKIRKEITEKRKIKIRVLSKIDNSLIGIFDSISECEKQLKITNVSTIIRNLKKSTKYKIEKI